LKLSRSTKEAHRINNLEVLEAIRDNHYCGKSGQDYDENSVNKRIYELQTLHDNRKIEAMLNEINLEENLC
jgi:hypothetical protein